MKDRKTIKEIAIKVAILQLFFLNLKFLEVVDWNWWFVFVPVWITLSLVVIGLLIYIPIYIVENDSKQTKNE